MSRAPRVLNYSKVGLCVPGAVFVGRPSPYGNPFIVGRHGVRGECIEKFADWVQEPAQKKLVEKAKAELKGKDLICYCAPRPCHGSVWLRIVNG